MADMVKAILNGEHEIILPKHRADRPEWYTEDGWEKKRLKHMKSTLFAGETVYYVGAEEGEMCALLSLWGADIGMFEPNEKVSPNIKAIWKANKLKNPIFYFEGFAANKTDLKGKLAMTIGDFPKSANGEVIGDHGFKELAYEHDVIPQIKIDDVVSDGFVKPPDMITMDVEGSEFEVIRGAEQTLRKYKPKIYLSLHPEFMFNMFNEYSADLRNFIKDLGYREVFIDYQHEVHLYYESN